MKTWGGKRKGSGRPAPEVERVRITASVLPKTKRFISNNMGVPIGQFLDAVIKHYRKFLISGKI